MLLYEYLNIWEKMKLWARLKREGNSDICYNVGES